jgi:DNA-binding transcriptional MocR family regulator
MHCHSETIQQIASSGVYRSGGGNNPVSAGIVHSILEQNLLRDHVKQLNKVLKERKIVLCNALRAYCCECSFEVPDEGGGYFVWIKLPSGFDSTKLLEISSKQGVAFTPGERCSLDGQMRNYCRFSFAFYTSEEIQEGIKRLGMILRSKINS